MSVVAYLTPVAFLTSVMAFAAFLTSKAVFTASLGSGDAYLTHEVLLMSTVVFASHGRAHHTSE